jgi:uncharacterized membrane protein
MLFLIITAFIVTRFTLVTKSLLATDNVGGALSPAGPVFGNQVFIQEVTMQKNYLHGLDLLMATWNRHNTNTNYVLLCNARGGIIHVEKLKSESISDNKYRSIRPAHSIYIGKGNKFFLCICSPDGTAENNITFYINDVAPINRLFTSSSDHFLQNCKNRAALTPLSGQMVINTYESQSRYHFYQYFIWFLLLAVSFIIVFNQPLRQFLPRVKLRVHVIYLVVALPFGMVFVFLTPPMQVPDEFVHFVRSSEISELDFLQLNQTIPLSFVKFSEKSSVTKQYETLPALTKAFSVIRHDNEKRVAHWSYWYVVPYIPQGIGIFLAKQCTNSVQAIFYAGRMANLVAAILLIFLAIRIIPHYKWLTALIACMPMAITQMASFSYDALNISLSLLFIAQVLRLKVPQASKIDTRKIIALIITGVLLASGRPVYTCLGLLFLIIPPENFGSNRKFLGLFLLLLISMAVVPYLFFIIRSWFALPETRLPLPWMEPSGQIDFIRHNFFSFITILGRSLYVGSGFIIESYVGILGWVDNPLPGGFIYGYLVVMMLTALFHNRPHYRLTVRDKLLSLLILVIGILAIEISLYLTWTPIGAPLINGFQGRYLIPFSLLFFMLLHNGFLHKTARILISAFLELLLCCTIFFSMVFTIVTILSKYYLI